MSTSISLGYIIHYVSDVKKSLTFYAEAFDFEIRFVSPDGDYGELVTGTTTLAFVAHELAKSNLKEGYVASDPGSRPPGVEIGLVTQEVDVVVERAIQNGASLESAPKVKPWGQTVAYVRDPDGLLVEICSPMS